MGSVYSNDLISQLNLGEGQTLYGNTPLVILKSFLQSGVSYVGDYPGALTARLIDVISDAKVFNKYIESTIEYTKKNYDLGALVTKSGSLIKGYGDVRTRTVDVFCRYI